ncbi:MAG: hypothetical protein ICV73_25490 [Acetobacteraceae bacterium]|nr:hypothetical protein [Acetobacteraceae bacterium]
MPVALVAGKVPLGEAERPLDGPELADDGGLAILRLLALGLGLALALRLRPLPAALLLRRRDVRQAEGARGGAGEQRPPAVQHA